MLLSGDPEYGGVLALQRLEAGRVVAQGSQHIDVMQCRPTRGVRHPQIMITV